MGVKRLNIFAEKTFKENPDIYQEEVYLVGDPLNTTTNNRSFVYWNDQDKKFLQLDENPASPKSPSTSTSTSSKISKSISNQRKTNGKSKNQKSKSKLSLAYDEVIECPIPLGPDNPAFCRAKVDSIIIDANNLKFTLCDMSCNEVATIRDNLRMKQTQEIRFLWSSTFNAWCHPQIEELCNALGQVLNQLNCKIYFVEDGLGFVDGRKMKARDDTPGKIWKHVGILRKLFDQNAPNQKDFAENVHGLGTIFKKALKNTIKEENLICIPGSLEADSTLARIAYIEQLNGRVAYIMTNDSDLLLYPHVKGVISSIIDFSTAHPNIQGKPPAMRFKCFYPEQLNRELFQLELNNSVDHMKPAVWAAFNGNDYIWQSILCHFHDKQREKYIEHLREQGMDYRDIDNGDKQTTVSLKEISNWENALKYLEVYSPRYRNLIQTKLHDDEEFKMFIDRRKDLKQFQLDSLEPNFLRLGISKISVKKYKGDENYQISFNVKDIKFATLIEAIVYGETFDDEDSPIMEDTSSINNYNSSYIPPNNFGFSGRNQFGRGGGMGRGNGRGGGRGRGNGRGGGMGRGNGRGGGRGSVGEFITNLRGRALLDSENPFMYTQVLRENERFSLFKRLASAVNLTDHTQHPIDDCAELIFRAYCMAKEERQRNYYDLWHIMYKYHIEKWLQLKTIKFRRVTEELLIEKFQSLSRIRTINFDQDKLSHMRREMIEYYQETNPDTGQATDFAAYFTLARQADHLSTDHCHYIYSFYHSNPTDQRQLERRNKFRMLVDEWLFRDVKWLVTQTRIKETLLKAINVYTLMHGFNWDVSIKVIENNQFVQRQTQKTGIIDIKLLTSKEKQRFPIVDTFPLIRILNDAKYTIQMLGVDLQSVSITGEEPQLYLSDSEYQFGQIPFEKSIWTRPEPKFNYIVTKITNIYHTRFEKEKIEFQPLDAMSEEVKSRGIEKDLWKSTLLKVLDLSPWGHSLDTIFASSCLDQKMKEPVELLFITLYYWLEKTEEKKRQVKSMLASSVSTTSTRTPETWENWFLQVRWMKALIAVIFKRLYETGPFLPLDVRDRPTSDVVNLMATWVDLISNMTDLIDTIDRYRKFIAGLHRNVNTVEEYPVMKGDVYDPNFSNLYSSGQVEEKTEKNEENKDITGQHITASVVGGDNKMNDNNELEILFAKPSDTSFTLNIFLIDWKSITRALEIDGETTSQNEALIIFFQKCGLREEACNFANEFYKLLWSSISSSSIDRVSELGNEFQQLNMSYPSTSTSTTEL